MLPFYERGGFKEWLYQNMIAFDQQVSAFFNGNASETISARCYRCNDRNPYKWMEKRVDWLYGFYQGPGHCKRRYEKELAGANRPTPKPEPA